jgi:hypothetical protein
MKIKKIVRFEEIRKVWKKENEFSEWLVTEDRVALLAEELGIKVENLTRESRPADYPSDIVGNQLGNEFKELSLAPIIEFGARLAKQAQQAWNNLPTLTTSFTPSPKDGFGKLHEFAGLIGQRPFMTLMTPWKQDAGVARVYRARLDNMGSGSR